MRDKKHEPEPTEAAPSHICGLEGYGHLDDPPCPACEVGRKKAEREAVVGGQPPKDDWTGGYIPTPEEMSDPNFCSACRHVHTHGQIECFCYCDKVSCKRCGPRIANRVVADTPRPEMGKACGCDLTVNYLCDKHAKERRDYKQAEIDISNLRFYARMAVEFKWQTDVIGTSVIDHTLNEIANRLAAASGTESAPTCSQAMKHFDGCDKCSSSYLEAGAATVQPSSLTQAGPQELQAAIEYFELWWTKGNPYSDTAKHAEVLIRAAQSQKGGGE